ncbi:hypothetical protein Salat_2906600 [Sesamum alatum]|uniref:CCHC-type domain-containing protein n=1 Tax=Sesamum alatum TaxID=300844 RepID=A0AAE2C8G9_9LAMI|nr:hypothetical protein Salat_2906600 [Sesamum alatum]
MRVRVSLNVHKPLQRVLKLKAPTGEKLLVTFTYERLLNICYICGVLGHLSRFCEKQFDEDFTDPGSKTPFGPWLRANHLPAARSRVQSSTSMNMGKKDWEEPPICIESQRGWDLRQLQ